ncbi:MAG: gamma-glutamylcyclotransferase family protein [Verrucomicrobiota bacterium]|nr:gamma-glutamylcyclotransferase family protein [Verrucomicrobiota bacterium]
MFLDNQLFAYGTLMFSEVWLYLIGRECPRMEAKLLNHSAFIVNGYTFPGLRETKYNHYVKGILYSGITKKDWDILDAFEDNFYERVPVKVHSEKNITHLAYTYIVKPENYGELSDDLWDVDWFKKNMLGQYMDRICGFL